MQPESPRVRSVACTGAPRDLGLDQGRACRDEIRADLGASPRTARPTRWLGWIREAASAREAGLARDLARHFPHLDERVAGLAQGAGVSPAQILALTEVELVEAPSTTVRFDSAARALELGWSEPLPPTGLVARTARPDGGYANLTLTRPGLVFALAGVNEHGLGGVVEHAGGAAGGAPAVLLLEQCIERLDGVEKALEWCERRPGAGRARLVFADAGGAAGAIEIDGERRRRVVLPTGARADAAGTRARVDCPARSIEVSDGTTTARFALAADA